MSNFTLADNSTDDIIDSRDIVERIEELEAIDGIEEKIANLVEDDDAKELVTLREFVDEIEQYAGDKASDGITLIHSTHFVDYVQELLEDCGELPKNLPHYIAIDWEVTARNVQVDYTYSELDGANYLYC